MKSTKFVSKKNTNHVKTYTYNIQLFNYRGSILEEVLLSVISNERIVFNLKPHSEGPTMSTMEASSVYKARKNAAR